MVEINNDITSGLDTHERQNAVYETCDAGSHQSASEPVSSRSVLQVRLRDARRVLLKQMWPPQAASHDGSIRSLEYKILS